MLRDLEPNPVDFDPEVDRLLITTSWNDTFVVRQGPNSSDSFNHIIDPQFMPDNLKRIPRKLRYEGGLSFPWDANDYPWYVFLYDGEMTGGGPFVDLRAVGLGWRLPISAHVTIVKAVSVRIDQIDTNELCQDLSGIRFGDFEVFEDAMIEGRAEELMKSLQ